jgi:hypothetical protein
LQRNGPPNCRWIDPHREVESAMNAKGLATAKPLAPHHWEMDRSSFLHFFFRLTIRMELETSSL